MYVLVLRNQLFTCAGCAAHAAHFMALFSLYVSQVAACYMIMESISWLSCLIILSINCKVAFQFKFNSANTKDLSTVQTSTV